MFIKKQLFRIIIAIVTHVYQLRCHLIKTSLAVTQVATPLIQPNFHFLLVTIVGLEIATDMVASVTYFFFFCD